MPLQPVNVRYKAPRLAAQTKVYQAEMVPSPFKGLDVSTPITNQDTTAAILLDNFLCRRMGVELRAGSVRWKTNLGGVLTPSPVISVMAYNPPRGSGSTFTPRLFAACANGNIYDVTNQSNEATVPPVAINIPGQLVPGRFSWTNFSSTTVNYLCICAAGAGYWTFDDVGGWVDHGSGGPNGITGPSAAIVKSWDFVMSWKNRLWFIANNTADAYYLGTNNIQGPAANFDFGPLLVHGGDLTAMASWTVDGGDGIDDKLVLVGRGGDVLIYEGTDPSSASTFQIVGRWFTGRPPTGRRFLSKYGGDLAMITERGIEYMSRLLQGMGLLDPESRNDANNSARRFNEVIGRDVRATRGLTFWRIIQVTNQDGVVILSPYNAPNNNRQYFFGALSQGWSRLTGWPATTMEEFDGDLYYGTAAGTVCKAFVGTTDDQLSDGTLGRDPDWQLQSSFVAPRNDRVSLKRPQLVNVQFQSPTPPSVKVRINTEWSVTPVPGSPAAVQNVSGLWDISKWDEAVWDGDNQSYHIWVGALGLGVYFSLRLAVRALPGTVFTGWKILYEPGGPM